MPATKHPQFISKASAFLCILEQKRPIRDAAGNTTWEGGLEIDFERGNPDVTGDGMGRYTATDPEIAEKLREAKTFNTEFVELGKEPGRLLPDEDELLGKITDYSVDGNAEKIREIKINEEATHNRPRVVQTAERALGRLGEPDGKRGPGRPPVKTAA